MENLNFIKFAFNKLIKSAKKDIEKAFSKQNVEKVFTPIKKTFKNAEEEINDFFENIKFTAEESMRMGILPTKIYKKKKTTPTPPPKPAKKTVSIQRKERPQPPKKRIMSEDTEENILWKIVKTKSIQEKERLLKKLSNEFIRDRKALIGFVMKDGKTNYYTFNESLLDKIDKMLAGEGMKKKSYGSDDEIINIFLDSEVKEIKIEYIEEGRRDKGRYMKYYHSIDLLDLRILQISRNVDDVIPNINAKDKIEDNNFVNQLGLAKDKPTNMKTRSSSIRDHCLIHSLKVLGASNEDIEKVKEYIGYNSFRTRDLKPLSELLKCFFKLTVVSHNEKSGQTTSFGLKDEVKKYHLVLYDGHYMPNIEFELTKYAIINYEEVKKFTNWNRVKYIQTFKDGRKVAQREKSHKIDTITVITSLRDSKRFYWNDTIYEKTEQRNEFDLSKITDKNLEECQELVEQINPKKTNKDFIFGADFESIVVGVNRHKAFLLGCVSLDGSYSRIFKANEQNLNDNSIFGDMLQNIVEKFGDKLKLARQTDKQSKFIIYFHNLKYDYSLIQSYSFITISNECVKGGQLYSATFNYKGFTFELRDSYKMISMPLRDFQQSLDLKNGKKDFSIYEYFTEENLTKELAPLHELQKFDPTLTKERLKKRGLSHFLEGDNLRVLDFYVDYMIADCETMVEGLKKFDEMMLSQIGLSIFDFLTISSLANCHLSNKCYKDVCKVSGLLREFITASNVGGRVCLKDGVKQNRTSSNISEFIEDSERIVSLENKKDLSTAEEEEINNLKEKCKKWRDETPAIQDFDGVSLYPSAMSISSLPKGKAKTLSQEQIKELEKNTNQYDHYVVEVLIELEGYQQIPFVSGMNEDGTRDWTNKPVGKFVMTKIDLVNLPKYYKIKNLKITQGVYWNEGLNSEVQETIKQLFNARAKAKREGNNGLQNMLKLFMNSAYGKCNVKPSKSNIKYVRKKELSNFVKNNYEFIKHMTCLDENNNDFDRYRVKLTKHTYIHSNLAHIAGVYLSNSKVIMNDLLHVFTIEGKEAFYTDTDSIHMYEKDIPIIATKYKEIYNRDLIGKNLGQFHDDFQETEVKKRNKYGDKIPKKERKSYPQKSVGFIGLGKKAYLDVLVNDFNNEIDYHVRFKGANRANIEHYCKNNKTTILDFYTKLYNGKTVRLDLCGGKTRFDYDEKGRVFTKKQFLRNFKF